jgi:WD40 repeat protein
LGENQLVVSSSSDQTVKIWDPDTGECLRTLEDSLGTVLTIDATKNSMMVAAGSRDQKIRIWDANNGECLGILTDRLCEGMNITGVKGLTPATIASLKALGAIEDEEVSETVE